VTSIYRQKTSIGQKMQSARNYIYAIISQMVM